MCSYGSFIFRGCVKFLMAVQNTDGEEVQLFVIKNCKAFAICFINRAKSLFSVPRKITLFFFLFCKNWIAQKRRQTYYMIYLKSSFPLCAFTSTILNATKSTCY
jgi:hypothetical protein